MAEQSIRISPEEFAEEYMRDDPHRMMVVHISKEEIEALDMLQNGENIDPKTGLHEYSALATIFDDPEVRRVAMEAMHQSESPEGESPELEYYYSLGKEREKSFRNAPGDKNPIAEEVADDGKYGDDELALLPVNVMHAFGEMRGYLSINPDGLFEFFFNKIVRAVGNVIKAPVKLISKGLQAVGVRKNHANEFLRAVGTIGGYIYGGPVGAGIGNAYASYGTGKSLKDSAISGVKNWALGKGVQAIPTIASHASGIGSSLATGNVGAAANGIGHGLSSAANSIGNSVSGLVNSIPGMGGTAGAAAGAAGAAKAGTAAAAAGNGLSNLASLASIATPAIMYMSSRQDAKANEKRYREYLENEEKEARARGFRDKWEEPGAAEEYVDNPRLKNRTRAEIERGIFPGPARLPKRLVDRWENAVLPLGAFSKGGSVNGKASIHKEMVKCGLVRGPGKGQDDKILTHIPAGSYVIDATSVADLGDGSSEAGGQVLDKFLHSKKGATHLKNKKTSDVVPVYLSDLEYVVPPHKVDALGDGNNDHGAYLLKGLVKQLRKHKNSNGDRLPPKAKSIETYIRKSGRK